MATATTHEDKAAAAHDHFRKLLGTKSSRASTINWDEIDLPSVSNEGLDNPFSEAEVWAAIVASPAEKAPGPDGFSGTFFRACWSVIKDDIMAVFDHFYRLADGSFSDLNTAMIALIPKKNGASSMGDFRPISLVHSIGKLITKVLSMRLATVINKIISPAQTAF